MHVVGSLGRGIYGSVFASSFEDINKPNERGECAIFLCEFALGISSVITQAPTDDGGSGNSKSSRSLGHANFCVPNPSQVLPLFLITYSSQQQPDQFETKEEVKSNNNKNAESPKTISCLGFPVIPGCDREVKVKQGQDIKYCQMCACALTYYRGHSRFLLVDRERCFLLSSVDPSLVAQEEMKHIQHFSLPVGGDAESQLSLLVMESGLKYDTMLDRLRTKLKPIPNMISKIAFVFAGWNEPLQVHPYHCHMLLTSTPSPPTGREKCWMCFISS